jgi:hypothetical protein
LKKPSLLLITAMLLASAAIAFPARSEPGTAFGLEFGAGIQGIFSMFEAGVAFPKLNRNFGIALRARYLSSLTYATYIDSAGKYVSFHPCVVGGALAMGGRSPVYRDLLRAYGTFELMLGHSFTPWDDFVAHTGNLTGRNLTYIASGVCGLELFTSRRTAIFLETGGGFKSIKGDKGNRYVQAGAWLGSGVTARMGGNLYL